MADDSDDVQAILARHYIWQSLVARAGDIPQPLLAQVAQATANEVPALPDPVDRVEWHIMRIIEVAKATLAMIPTREGSDNSGQELQRSQSALLTALLGGLKIPHMTYPCNGDRLIHLREGGDRCETPLPAVCCACGLYLLIAEDLRGG